MTGYEIRRALPEDTKSCARVVFGALLEYGIEPEPEGADRDVFAIGRRGGRFVDLVAVAGEAGEVVGVGCLEPWDMGGWISKLFLASRARGLGLGRGLLDALIQEARRGGMTHLGLRTRTVFREAVALYEAVGFTRDGLPPQRGAGEDCSFRLDLSR